MTTARLLVHDDDNSSIVITLSTSMRTAVLSWLRLDARDQST